MVAVWVTDHGLHQELSAMSMHLSAEAAAESVRRRFQAPFEVEWEPLAFSPDGDQAVLVGAAPPGLGFPDGYMALVLLQRWNIDDQS